MADDKRPPVKFTGAAKPVPAELAPAAESGDPAVHQLMAEIQTARSNNQDDVVTGLTKRLADLGYQ